MGILVVVSHITLSICDNASSSFIRTSVVAYAEHGLIPVLYLLA